MSCSVVSCSVGKMVVMVVMVVVVRRDVGGWGCDVQKRVKVVSV
jgi:hypothetical protein